MSSISEEAVKYVKDNKIRLIKEFADLDLFPAAEQPESIFMAGSPGAGKTESSKAFIKARSNMKIVRIDADAVKEKLPQYNGKNSDDVQVVANLVATKLFDYCIKNKQHIILDSTFSNHKRALENVHISINKKRKVSIFFIYQDPLIAWEFTIARGRREGRYVPKDFFIEAFFQAQNNANDIKKIFGDKISLDLMIKNANNIDIEKVRLNINNLDNELKSGYTRESLEKILH